MDLRISLLLMGFLGVLSFQALAQERPQQKIIRKISVKNLKRLSEPSVVAKMKIRIGEIYDPLAVSEETGRLFKTGDFSRVEDPVVVPFEDGFEVIFEVEEKPRIVAVKFDVRDNESGRPSISSTELEEAISTQSDGRLSAYSLKVDAERIRQLYQEKGYTFAEVRTAVQEKATGAQVAFIIDEGPKVRIRKIEFIGNQAIDDGDLQMVMETRPKDILFFGLIYPGYYDPEKLSRDIDRVTNFYRSKGFFEARAAVDDLIFSPSMERLRIVIRIEEGARYTFRGYEYEGNRIFSTTVLAALTRAPLGQPYNEEQMLADRREITKYYNDRAYIDAQVTPQKLYSDFGTDVRILFQIEEGSEIYIEHIHIQGNHQTQDRVIRRELEIYPGEKINYSKFEKSRSNLSRLRYFSDIRFRYEDGSSLDKKNVIVEVDEESTGRMNLGFGLSSGYGIIGNFSIHKRNFDLTDLPESIYDIPDSFTGAGQTVNLEIQPGTVISVYRATFVEPYLFETRNSLSLRGAIFSHRRDDFEEGRMSFLPRIGHAFDFDRDLVFSIGGRFEQVEISKVEPDSAPDVKEVVGYTTVIALNATLSYNKVLEDRWEGPFSGHSEMVTYEYGGEPLGGEVDFHKPEADLSLFFPLYVTEESQLHHVLSIYTRLGLIEEHHDTESIPIFERFFLGGPNSVRGFRIRGLGPHYGNDALGGTATWFGNIEYTFPLFQKYLRGLAFFDYGNLATDLEAFRIKDMRLVLGGGIRINFPFLGGGPLPINLYFGHAFKKEDQDRPRIFLFSIGWPF